MHKYVVSSSLSSFDKFTSEVKKHYKKSLKFSFVLNKELILVSSSPLSNFSHFLNSFKNFSLISDNPINKIEYRSLQITKDKYNHKFVETVSVKFLINFIKKKYSLKDIFDSDNSIIVENTNVRDEETKDIAYSSKTSGWYKKQKEMLIAFGLNEKEIVPFLHTNSYQKRLMGDYIISCDIKDKQKELLLFDIKNYEGLPFALKKQVSDLKQVFSSDEDIENSFSKTSDPNIHLLNVIDLNFYQEYLLRKIEQNFFKNDKSFSSLSLSERETLKKSSLDNFLSLKNKLLKVSSELNNLEEDNVEEYSFKIDNDLFLYEIIKLFENGYLSNLYSLNGFTIQKHLITVTRNSLEEIETKIKKVNLPKIKEDLISSENNFLKFKKINGYLHITIFIGNKPLYNFSFRRKKNLDQFVSNSVIVNNEYLDTISFFNHSQTLSVMNKPNLFFSPNKNQDLLDIIEEETINLSVSSVSIDRVLNKYLQLHEHKLSDLFKTYSQIPTQINNKIQNFYDYNKLRQILLERLKKDINPNFSKLLEANSFVREKYNNKVYFVFKGDLNKKLHIEKKHFKKLIK